MVALGVPEAGLAIAGANFLLSQASKMNTFTHTVMEFKERVDNVERKVARYNTTFQTWMTSWHYSNDERFPETIYEALWGDSYKNICKAYNAVENDISKINEHLERVRGSNRRDKKWKKVLDLPRKMILKRIAYAIFSDDSLAIELNQLNNDLEDLKSFSENRLQELKDKNSSKFYMRFQALSQFGQDLFQGLRDSPNKVTGAWRLELCHPELCCPGLGDFVEEWHMLSTLEVWLSSLVLNPAPAAVSSRRTRLKYTIGSRSIPENWVNQVVTLANDSPNDPDDRSKNPVLFNNSRHSITKTTKSFRALFKGGFFVEEEVYIQWMADQAYLVLALAHWSWLLLKSDWTKILCCSGLHFHFVQPSSITAVGARAISMPSLSILHDQRQEHHPEVNQPQGEQLQAQPPEEQEGQQAFAPGCSDCKNVNRKLQNIGLVLAESICRIPFRKSTHYYEMWGMKDATPGWVEIESTGLLDIVKEETKCDMVKNAINFCLNTADPQDGDFCQDYIKKVIEP
ncbi:hypothetical protein B7494_g2625 [Chlorociboria aeruginascens]|nr:hypothetical protein B7494_g2625 [Chlorociboria aeruginascens]